MSRLTKGYIKVAAIFALIAVYGIVYVLFHVEHPYLCGGFAVLLVMSIGLFGGRGWGSSSSSSSDGYDIDFGGGDDGSCD